jgi:diketogulonate reductase-like aldo/keto reductase
LSAQVYSPPYLFRGARPIISSAPGTGNYGAVLNILTPDAARIASVTLMAIGSVTHAFDENQRIVPLSYGPISGGVAATLPTNPNVMPPGYYMLFLIDTNGVPSISTMLKVGAGPSDTIPPTAPASLTATANGTQISLNWLLQRKTVSNIVIGARNEKQLVDNLGAVGWALTPAQISRIDAVSAQKPLYPHWVGAR